MSTSEIVDILRDQNWRVIHERLYGPPILEHNETREHLDLYVNEDYEEAQEILANLDMKGDL